MDLMEYLLFKPTNVDGDDPGFDVTRESKYLLLEDAEEAEKDAIFGTAEDPKDE